MKALVKMIRGGAQLDAIAVHAWQNMHRINRLIFFGRPDQKDVVALTVERWWLKTVGDAACDRGMSEKSRLDVIRVLADCVDYGENNQKECAPETGCCG